MLKDLIKSSQLLNNMLFTKSSI